MKINLCTLLFLLLMLFNPLHLDAQEKKLPGIPPAKVVVSNVTSGFIAPEGEFIGTVYYQEVSDVASEVSGLAEIVSFEEGQRVKKGAVLVVISSDLLHKTIQSAKAKYEQVLPDRDRLKAAGMTAGDFGIAVDVLLDGRKIGDFKEEGRKKIDMVIKAPQDDIRTPEELHDTTISTSQGRTIPVSSISGIEWKRWKQETELL